MDYWAWWWRTQVSPDAKIVAAVVAIGLLGIGGYVAANGLEGSVGGAEAGGAEVEVMTTTVQKLVTVRAGDAAAADQAHVAGPAQTVLRQVQVAGPATRGGRVTDRVTQVQVQTVAGEAETRVVTQRQVVPVIRRQRVTVAGDVRTVVQTASGGTETRTVERVVERAVERVVTQERVVTVVVPRPVTETVVVTVETPVTVTAGPITLTVTVRLPPVPTRP